MQLTKNKLLYRDTDVIQLQHMMQYNNFNMCSVYRMKSKNKLINENIKQKTHEQKKSKAQPSICEWSPAGWGPAVYDAKDL